MSDSPQRPLPAPTPTPDGPASAAPAPADGPARDAAWYFHCVRAAAAVLDPGGSARPALPEAPPEPPDRLTFPTVHAAQRWIDAARTTVRWTVHQAQQDGRDTDAWTLALALHEIYAHRNWFADWFDVAETGLACARRAGHARAEAMLLESLGKARVQAGDRRTGLSHLHEAVGLWDAMGGTHETLSPLNAVGVALLRDGHATPALGVFGRVLDRVDGPAAHYWRSLALANTAAALQTAGRPAEALELLPDLLTEHRARNEPVREGNILRLLSQAHRALGDPHRAYETIRESLDIADALNNTVARAFRWLEAGHVLLDLGRHGEAQEYYHRCAAAHRQLGDREREALALAGTARVHTARQCPEDALSFHHRAAHTLRELDSRRNLAHTLIDTAATLRLLGEEERSREHLREARALLAEFDDPAADALREHIDTATSPPGP